ncbi:MAG: hypothetical protein ED557_08460 [Balneola sp.]|nr:MAG: hypothetical protein ED557_08460 [Balneola sp.]
MSNKVKLFPSKKLKVELYNDHKSVLADLKEYTDKSYSLVSDWTDKEFRGIVNESTFKVISSEIGYGAMCVFEGKFDGDHGIIEIQLHKAFKGLLLAMPLSICIPFIIGILTNEMTAASLWNLLFIMPLFFIFVRLIFAEIGFRIVSRIGLKKLLTILQITHLEEVQL